MRFSLLHKLASYLLLAAGFAAVGLSGELSPAVIALTVVPGALSFFFEPDRFDLLRSRTWTVVWNILTVALFAWLALGVFRGDPVLLVGVRFLCFLLVNKLWNRRASRDWLQAYAVSFLMLVAGTVLNSELAFAGCFFVYVVAFTWALTLFHLRREMEESYLLKHGGDVKSERVEVARILNSKRVVGGSFLASTSAISAGIFLVSTVFFFAFPRVGFNVFFSHARRGLTVGFDDKGVELGGNGLIKDNDQVVMRIEFPDTNSSPGNLYYRGISFDTYRNGRWTPSESADRRRLARLWDLSVIGFPHRAKLDEKRLRQDIGRSLRQEVYLEPMDASVLFAAERPLAVAVPSSRPGGPLQPLAEGAFFDEAGRDSTGDVYASNRQGGLRYTAWSLVAPPRDDELKAVPMLSPARAEDLDNYLDIEGVPPEVLELGRHLTAKEIGPYRKAQAVLRYLHGNYGYTTDLIHDEKKEPLAEFLFERKRGHCEYFASAMAVLLRAAGVPTRHVAGFYGGEWNDVGHYLQVRQRDSHAWVEVYLGDLVGWVPMDPTPSTGIAGRNDGIVSRFRQMLDLMELTWFKYVIEYDINTQLDLLSRFRRYANDWSSDPKKKKSAAAWNPDWKKMGKTGGVLLVLALGVFLLRRRRIGGPGVKRERVAVRAQQSLARAIRALARRGIARAPADTPRAIGVHAEARGDPGSAAFKELVELYYEARYGRRPIDEARLTTLSKQVVRPSPNRAPFI